MSVSPETPVVLAAVARPGDTIIFGFARAISDDEIETMIENFKPLTDSGIKVGFADQVTSMTIARTGGADEEINDWGDG